MERTSSQLRATPLVERPSASPPAPARRASPVSCARCQASLSDVEVSASEIAARVGRPFVHRPGTPRGRRTQLGAGQGTPITARPGRCRRRRRRRAAVSRRRGAGAPLPWPPRGGSDLGRTRHVFDPMPSSWKEPRCSASNPQRTQAPFTNSSRRKRSSSVKRNRRRTGSRPARSTTSVAVMRAEDELEHLGQDAHHWVGLPQRTVGQADLERALGVRPPAVWALPAKRRLDEGRERLDIGTQDDDVAGLEIRSDPP